MNTRKIAIMMRIRLDGECLNNEGNIGNVMQPRQVELCDGTIRQALSGEMLKHYHSRNLRLLSEDNELCDTCKIFSPMKNSELTNIDDNLSTSGNRTKTCIIDDIHGFMNAGKGRNEKRTSVIKFGWAIATQENDYQTMLHSRVDSNTGGGIKKKDKKANANGTTDESNTISEQNTQMVFHRPIRSNEYAINIQVDLDRIGFDDEKLIYAISDEDIKLRKQKCLDAIRNMFIDMEGALCSTRLPHISNIEGIIVDKKDKNDILSKYTSLNDDYIEVNSEISKHSYIFNNIKEFVSALNKVI